MEEAKREGDPYTDQFEIVKYPGLAMEWEYRDDSNPEVWGPIIRSTTELDLSKPEYAGYTFLRAPARLFTQSGSTRRPCCGSRSSSESGSSLPCTSSHPFLTTVCTSVAR